MKQKKYKCYWCGRKYVDLEKHTKNIHPGLIARSYDYNIEQKERMKTLSRANAVEIEIITGHNQYTAKKITVDNKIYISKELINNMFKQLDDFIIDESWRKDGYYILNINGKRTLEHRFILEQLGFDLTGKIKFGTASESQGLGTGKNDYTLELDAYKPVSDHAIGFAGLGYKKMGDPRGTNLRNVWLGSIGVSYKINPLTNLGIMADYRQKTLETS